MTTDGRHDDPRVGDIAWHRERDLDPRRVLRIVDEGDARGAFVVLDLAGRESPPLVASAYEYSTPQHTTARRRDAALRAALATHREIPDREERQALNDVVSKSAPYLHGLADRLNGKIREYLVTEPSATRTPVVVGYDDLVAAAGLARDAATYGYPRPPLEQLGAQAGHLPAARSSDPVTARESGERTRSTPSARNHLGRLLVGFLMYERAVNGQALSDLDATLTSEEVAHRVGLAGAEFAKRCSDLMQLGFIRVAQDTNGHDRTRRGDSGRQRLVFELTDDGRAMAERIRRTTGLA